jgi:hypothetical protein
MNDCFEWFFLAPGGNGANRSMPRAQAGCNPDEEEKDPGSGHMDIMTAHRKVQPERDPAKSANMAGL